MRLTLTTYLYVIMLEQANATSKYEITPGIDETDLSFKKKLFKLFKKPHKNKNKDTVSSQSEERVELSSFKKKKFDEEPAESMNKDTSYNKTNIESGTFKEKPSEISRDDNEEDDDGNEKYEDEENNDDLLGEFSETSEKDQEYVNDDLNNAYLYRYQEQDKLIEFNILDWSSYFKLCGKLPPLPVIEEENEKNDDVLASNAINDQGITSGEMNDTKMIENPTFKDKEIFHFPDVKPLEERDIVENEKFIVITEAKPSVRASKAKISPNKKSSKKIPKSSKVVISVDDDSITQNSIFEIEMDESDEKPEYAQLEYQNIEYTPVEPEIPDKKLNINFNIIPVAVVKCNDESNVIEEYSDFAKIEYKYVDHNPTAKRNATSENSDINNENTPVAVESNNEMVSGSSDMDILEKQDNPESVDLLDVKSINEKQAVVKEPETEPDMENEIEAVTEKIEVDLTNKKENLFNKDSLSINDNEAIVEDSDVASTVDSEDLTILTSENNNAIKDKTGSESDDVNLDEAISENKVDSIDRVTIELENVTDLTLENSIEIKQPETGLDSSINENEAILEDSDTAPTVDSEDLTILTSENNVEIKQPEIDAENNNGDLDNEDIKVTSNTEVDEKNPGSIVNFVLNNLENNDINEKPEIDSENDKKDLDSEDIKVNIENKADLIERVQTELENENVSDLNNLENNDINERPEIDSESNSGDLDSEDIKVNIENKADSIERVQTELENENVSDLSLEHIVAVEQHEIDSESDKEDLVIKVVNEKEVDANEPDSKANFDSNNLENNDIKEQFETDAKVNNENITDSDLESINENQDVAEKPDSENDSKNLAVESLEILNEKEAVNEKPDVNVNAENITDSDLENKDTIEKNASENVNNEDLENKKSDNRFVVAFKDENNDSTNLDLENKSMNTPTDELYMKFGNKSKQIITANIANNDDDDFEVALNDLFEIELGLTDISSLSEDDIKTNNDNSNIESNENDKIEEIDEIGSEQVDLKSESNKEEKQDKLDFTTNDSNYNAIDESREHFKWTIKKSESSEQSFVLEKTPMEDKKEDVSDQNTYSIFKLVNRQIKKDQIPDAIRSIFGNVFSNSPKVEKINPKRISIQEEQHSNYDILDFSSDDETVSSALVETNSNDYN